jgi:hypothetical protein
MMLAPDHARPSTTAPAELIGPFGLPRACYCVHLSRIRELPGKAAGRAARECSVWCEWPMQRDKVHRDPYCVSSGPAQYNYHNASSCCGAC